MKSIKNLMCVKPLVWQQLCFQTLGLVSVWQNSFYSAAVGSIGPILGPFDVWQTYGLGLSQFAGLVGRSVWTIIANHWLVVSDSGRSW